MITPPRRPLNSVFCMHICRSSSHTFAHKSRVAEKAVTGHNGLTKAKTGARSHNMMTVAIMRALQQYLYTQARELQAQEREESSRRGGGAPERSQPEVATQVPSCEAATHKRDRCPMVLLAEATRAETASMCIGGLQEEANPGLRLGFPKFHNSTVPNTFVSKPLPNPFLRLPKLCPILTSSCSDGDGMLPFSLESTSG